jgi:hypothetical protein
MTMVCNLDHCSPTAAFTGQHDHIETDIQERRFAWLESVLQTGLLAAPDPSAAKTIQANVSETQAMKKPAPKETGNRTAVSVRQIERPMHTIESRPDIDVIQRKISERNLATPYCWAAEGAVAEDPVPRMSALDFRRIECFWGDLAW